MAKEEMLESSTNRDLTFNAHQSGKNFTGQTREQARMLLSKN